MTGRYEAYPEYKDSGVEWLGEVPEHWNITELKRHSHVQGGYAFDSSLFKEEGEPVIRIGDIKQDGSVSLKHCKFVSKNIANANKLFSVKNGELVMAMTGATIGKAGWFKGKKPALVNQRVGVYKCNRKYLEYRFLWYILNSSGYQEHIKLTAFGGAQPNISDRGMVSYQTVTPSLDEQTQIANFLDHETTKIDTLISRQEQLIKLLKEKRQAVISHAVTKGLNPAAPRRDSGVEWLGEVPEHWNITEIRYITNQIGGGTPSKDQDEYWEGNIPWVSPKDMKINYIDDSQDKITDQAVRESSAKIVPKGSVLIVVRGMILLHSVPVALTMKKLTVNQDMKALVPTGEVNGEYLLFLLMGFRDFILDLVESSAHGTKCLRTEIFERMKLAIPSNEEQEEIVGKLKKKLDGIDSLFEKAYLSIDFLQERRTTLISAAVTGKIDVRNWQAQKPKQVNQEVAA